MSQQLNKLWRLLHGCAQICVTRHCIFTGLLACCIHLLPPQLISFTLADMAIAHIFWDEFGIMATDPGYGYFRPTINLFDPGWRLTPDGHDMGTHAAGVMQR